jgi:pilus assembly protein CpaB
MNRSKRTAVVVGVAVLLAATASFGIYRIVSKLPARGGEVATVDVVVAQRPLKLGTLITGDDVKVVRWPAETQVSDTFSKVENVVNRGVIIGVAANEPLTEAKLAPVGTGAGLPPSIPSGMRAISVKVNEVVGVAGFVVPGTRVDVMVTLGGKQQKDDSVTRVVVSNVQVLTAGTRYDQEKAKEGTPIPSTVVTLLVTPEDGERIALAAVEGQIMLALRNPLDNTPTTTPGVRTAGLLGQAAPPPVKPLVPKGPARPPKPEVAPPPPPKPAPYTVEAIRGAKRSEEIVR